MNDPILLLILTMMIERIGEWVHHSVSQAMIPISWQEGKLEQCGKKSCKLWRTMTFLIPAAPLSAASHVHRTRSFTSADLPNSRCNLCKGCEKKRAAGSGAQRSVTKMCLQMYALFIPSFCIRILGTSGKFWELKRIERQIWCETASIQTWIRERECVVIHNPALFSRPVV